MIKFIKLCTILLAFHSFTVVAQEKTTLYYDENWKGLDSKKKASFYRIANFDENDKPIGIVETFYKSGKLRSKGEATFIDKLDDSKTLWKNNMLIFNEKGVKIFDQSYDEEGKANGMWYSFKDNGDKKDETEFSHGNPTKDYYLVYDKGTPVKYSFLTLLPMKLATSGKKLVPITERKLMYDDGQPIQYYSFDGISVAVKFTREKAYGDYYAAYITIENGTDKEFNVNPSNFIAVLSKNGEVEEVEILSYDYYIKKVNRRQAWSAAFNAFAQQQAANQAGYSSSTTTGAVAASSATYSNASGYIGNAYGNVSSTTNSGAIAVGSSTTQNYNGSAQYAANQNAANNISQYNNQQYNIKKSIAQGYLKINTIFPSSRVIGYVNIKYQKADRILLNIPINGKVYQFGG